MLPSMTLPLPITPADALSQIVRPALALLPPNLDTRRARVLLVAIALQESGLAAREQAGGPARGLWQFERGVGSAGVNGVLTHPASAALLRALCAVRGVPATSYAIYMSIGGDDLLACGLARLLLLTDPAPMPALGDADAAWHCYVRNWRPGKPRPDAWPTHYNAALTLEADNA